MVENTWFNKQCYKNTEIERHKINFHHMAKIKIILEFISLWAINKDYTCWVYRF